MYVLICLSLCLNFFCFLRTQADYLHFLYYGMDWRRWLSTAPEFRGVYRAAEPLIVPFGVLLLELLDQVWDRGLYYELMLFSEDIRGRFCNMRY